MTEEKNPKSNKELLTCWRNGDIDDLSLEELKRLEVISDIRNLPKENQKEPTGAKENMLTDSGGERKQVYDNDETGKLISWARENSLKEYENLWINTDSDASCPDDYSDWTPTEFFASYIMTGVATDCELAKLCKVKVDVGAGNGNKVVFRTVGTRTPTGDLTGAECISCCSTSWSKHEVTIKRFADYNVIGEFKSWQSMGTKEAELKEMKKGAIRYVDSEIYDAINESTPGTTETLDVAVQCDSNTPAGSCCSVSSGIYLYTSVIDLLTSMRAKNYEPDALLMHPTISAFFKYKDAVAIPFIMRGGIELDASGRLVKLAGVKVVECNRMSTCTNATGTKLIYAIQSDRSVGICWGQHAKFYNIYRGECDSWNVGYNAYFGVDSLDDDSIGVIKNP